MSDKLFDSFIQEKMQQHVSQVPSDMWNRILNEKERRDKAFWYRKWYAVAALLVLMLGSGAMYYYFNSGTDEIGSVPATVNGSSSKNNSTINSTDNSSNKSTPADNNHIVPGTTDDQKKEDGINTENNNTDLPTKNNSFDNTTVKFRFDKEKPNTYYSSITDKKESNTANDVIYGTENSIENVKRSLGTATIIMRETDFGNLNLSNLLKTFSGKGIPITACPTVNKEDGNQAFYFEAYVSPDYAWKKTTASNASFLNSKDSAESMRVSYSAGFRFAKPIGNHILLKAGLQYSQINEKFKVRQENERKTVTIITTRNIQTSPGVFTTVSDTSSYEQIGYVTKTSYNKYKNIDVPVLLSYEWGDEDVKFAVTGGAIINVHSSAKGQTIDSSGATYSFDKSNSAYKTNTGVGVYGSFSITKSVGEKTDIFAEPYVRYNLSNMTKDGSGFTQKFNTAGINLGIRVNIGRQR